ncbi:MAG: ATP-binding protein [Candidatus Sericytochromatia bacterium]
MTAAPLPENESRRLAALASYQILDTPPEPAFDELVELAAGICEVPISLVSLVDAERQWFKARLGVNVNETPRDMAFCAHAILDSTPLIVPDAQLDTRFADNPLVQSDPQIRFYAGVPLTTEQGEALGTLCVLDRQARTLNAFQIRSLEILGHQVMQLLAQRRYAQQLVQHQQRLEMALASTEAGIWEISDLTTHQGWTSPQFEALLGYPPREQPMGPAEFESLIHPEDRQGAQQELQAHQQASATAPGQVFRREIRVKTAHAGYRWFSSQARLYQESAHSPPRMVGTLIDIDARKQAQARLENSERLLQAMSRVAQIGGWELDLQDQIPRWSEEVYRIHEVPPDYTPRLETAIEFYRADVREEISRAIEKAISTHTAWDLELPLITGQNREIWVRTLGQADYQEGQAVRLWGVFQDITVRKLAELERNAYIVQLQRLNLSKDRLLAVVAHDLRNPLAAIQSAKWSLERNLKRQEPLHPGFLQVIDEACHNGMTLIAELLEMAELEQEQLEWPLAPVDLVRWASEHLAGLQPQAERRQLQFSFLASEPEIWALAYLPKLTRVLDNLLHNALKFTPAGGHIRISLERQDTEVHLNVADTGIGIPEELLANLFEAFGRARRQGLAGEQSHGLGMSIVQQIIALHGGRISVSSQPQQGTCFQIVLPLATRPAPSPEASTPPPASSSA